MSKSLSNLGILALVFVSGIGLGLFVEGDNTQSRPMASTRAAEGKSIPTLNDMPRDHSGDSFLRFRIRGLEQELAARRKEDADLILEDRIALMKKKPYVFMTTTFDDGLHVTPDIAELLAFL